MGCETCFTVAGGLLGVLTLYHFLPTCASFTSARRTSKELHLFLNINANPFSVPPSCLSSTYSRICSVDKETDAILIILLVIRRYMSHSIPSTHTDRIVHLPISQCSRTTYRYLSSDSTRLNNELCSKSYV